MAGMGCLIEFLIELVGSIFLTKRGECAIIKKCREELEAEERNRILRAAAKILFPHTLT
jgi:hypothetical protein